MSYDVAIVGAGPVGLVSAIAARMAGLTVVLVEQRQGVIDKACGEGLMPGALPILERLGVAVAGRSILGITYNQDARTVTHRFAGHPGRGVRRTALHEALTARAAELGVVRVVARVDAIEQTPGGVTVGGVAARYLLACDGLHSTVARLVGLSRPAPKWRRRYGIRQHYRMSPWSDTVEVYYGPTAELYVTPVDEDEVGVAMLSARQVDFDDAVAAIPRLAERLEGMPLASSRRGAGPFRQRTRARTAGRVLLVGDSSGYVDAITGEGLRLGFAQAEAAVRAIVVGAPQLYEREWKSITHGFRLTTTALVWAATGPFRRAIVPLSAALPGRFGAVVESLAR
jgi:flavin-dependent dehydrogenase